MQKIKIGLDRQVFFISDTHFGHANIIKFCDRPYNSVEEMDEDMIKRWNEVIPPGKKAVVFVLGDFSFRGAPASEYLERLNGDIRIIPGNHDKVKDIPSDTLCHDIVSLTYGEQKFILCHYPMTCWLAMEHGSIHLFGHIHNTEEHNMKCKNLGEAYNVGADLLNFAPKQLDEIIAINKAYRGVNCWNDML